MTDFRDTRILKSSELTTAAGRLAEVITYKTRKPGTTWTYRTVVIGLKGDEGRAWFGTWKSAITALRGHADVCDKIHKEQAMLTDTLQ